MEIERRDFRGANLLIFPEKKRDHGEKEGESSKEWWKQIKERKVGWLAFMEYQTLEHIWCQIREGDAPWGVMDYKAEKKRSLREREKGNKKEEEE